MTKVGWKDEDEVDGVPIGPVFIDGSPLENPNRPGLPMWASKPQAMKFAEENNYEFEEV